MMGNRKTHEQFVEEVSNLFGDEYSIIGKYLKSQVKIEIKHNVCDYVWNVIPNNFLQGQSKCPLCSGKMQLTSEIYAERLKKIDNGEYTLLSEYKNNYTHVIVKHSVCDYEWEVKPAYITSKGQRCPRCQNRERYSDEEFKRKLEEFTDNEFISLDIYINNYAKINFKHVSCGRIFEESPIVMLYAEKRCPFCHDSLSKGERKVANFLETEGIKYKTQYTFDDCVHLSLLRFDFAILKGNKLISLIEYDGKQHYEPIEWFGGEEGFNLQRERDQIKNNYCKKNNIPLLRIPYWEEDIEEFISQFLRKYKLI